MTDVLLENDQVVISSKFGLGKIIGTQAMGENNDFYIIQSLATEVKSFIPVNDDKSFRTIGDMATVDKIYKQLQSVPKSKDHESKKDRIAYFKARALMQSLDDVLLSIQELYHLEDRGSAEDKIMQNLIESLSLEVSYIEKSSDEAAKEKLLEMLSQSK